MNPVYIGLRFLETLFNGDVLHSAMHNFPVQTIAMVYRRTGQMFRVFCCFGWVSALVSMIPFSKASAAGWIFRGAFLPLLVLYYFILNDVKIYLMPGTVYDINTFVATLLVAYAFGLLTIFLNPSAKYTEAEQAELNRRAQEYKSLMSLNVRLCSDCENFIMLRSMHSSLHNKCIVKYEYQSWVLNTAIGARNLLPMFFFNMFIFILHYLILEISFNQIDNPGFDKMSVFSIFRLYLTAILGFIFAWKEFFICFVSLITGTTAYERARDLEVSYFKSRSGNTLCFYKGPFSHITEAFYAMIGYNPDNRKLSEGTSVIEADDDTDLMNQIDQKMSTLHNPYATKYVGNWQKIHLMTLLEIEGEVSDFMGKALRKALYMKMKGKDINVDSGSDEELDEAASDIMNEQKKMAMFRQEQTRRQCCSKDHGSDDHKHLHEDKPQTSNHSTGKTNIQSKSSDSHTHELDQSTSNLDQSYEI